MFSHNGFEFDRNGRFAHQSAMIERDAILAEAIAIVDQDRPVPPRLGDISPEIATAIMAVLIDRGADGFGELSDYFWAYGWRDDGVLLALYELYEGPHPFRDLWHEDQAGKLVLNFNLSPYRTRRH